VCVQPSHPPCRMPPCGLFVAGPAAAPWELSIAVENGWNHVRTRAGAGRWMIIEESPPGNVQSKLALDGRRRRQAGTKSNGYGSDRTARARRAPPPPNQMCCSSRKQRWPSCLGFHFYYLNFGSQLAPFALDGSARWQAEPYAWIPNSMQGRRPAGPVSRVHSAVAHG
jgi:hypothetical protein